MKNRAGPRALGGAGWYVGALGAVAAAWSDGPAWVVLPGVPYVVTGV